MVRTLATRICAASATALAISIAATTAHNSAFANHFGGIGPDDASFNFSRNTVSGWCEAAGVDGTFYHPFCGTPSNTFRSVSVCEFPEARSYTYQGQVTMYTGCRTGYNNQDITRGHGDRDAAGLYPTACVHQTTLETVDFGNTPLCHYAFPECAPGVEYKTAGNPFSGCPSACPTGQTENAATGECECPAGEIKNLDGSTCHESGTCPSGQVSDGDADNPQCILMCDPFLSDNSPNPQATLISLQSPVVSLVSARDGDDNFACRCPAGQVIRRDAQGGWECSPPECHRRFLITDPQDDTLQICATENVGGCTIDNGYDGDLDLPRRGDVSDGNAALLCDIRNLNRATGHRTDNCLLFHTVSTLTFAHGSPRCDIIAPEGLTRGGYGSRAISGRRTYYWNHCADGSEDTDEGSGCSVCAAGFFSSGGSMCAAGATVSFSGGVGGAVLASLDGSALSVGEVVRPGATVTFSAAPDSADYYVSGWEGGCAGSGERFGVLGAGRVARCAAGVSGEFSTRAVFSRATVAVSYSAGGASGTLSARLAGDGRAVPPAAAGLRGTLVFSARPGAEHYVSGWLGNCAGRGAPGLASHPGAERSCRFRVETAEVSVGVVFSQARRVGVAGVENGRVRIESGRDLDVFSDRGTTVWVAEGALATLTATPAPGYFVSDWTGDCGGAPVGSADVRGQAGALQCEVAATVHLEAGVGFRQGFRVDWQPRPAFGMLAASVAGGTTLTRDSAASEGATIIFAATPNPDYYVSGWEVGRFGTCDVGFANANLDAATQECEGVLNAEITPNTNAPIPIMTELPRSTIYFSAESGGTLTAKSGGAGLNVGDFVRHGASVTFNARPSHGWTLSAWTGDCAGITVLECATSAGNGNDVSVGVRFGDVDECAAEVNPCGTNSICANAEGSFSCSCEAGFQSPSGRDCSSCAPPTIADPVSGNCVNPGADVCSRFSPGQFFNSGSGQCEVFNVCSGEEDLDETTNVCRCNSPNVVTGTGCEKPSADVCEEFFDGTACVEFVDCQGAAERDSQNVCQCNSPNVGDAANCQAPSVDVCGGLSPARFFDLGTGACVDFVLCGGEGEVLERTTNECVCAGAATRDAGTGLCDCASPNVGEAADCQAPSLEVCGGLSPARFFDGGACVDFADCGGTGEVLDVNANECVCAVNRVRDGGTGECACPTETGWEIGGCV